MNPRARIAAVFGRSAARSGYAASAALPASSLHADGSGAPSGGLRAKLLLASLATLALVLALSVGLASAVAPVVTVEDATNVQYTTADVKGHVNPEGQFTEWRFQYATEADFSNAQDGPSGATEAEEDVSGSLGGLQPETTYHLRLLASNGDGQSEAIATNTFTTKAVAKPSVSGLSATESGFSGFVNPNAPEENALLSQPAKDAYATHWRFSCDPGCGFSGPNEGDLEADNSASEVTAEPSGLEPNKTYDVTLHASNAGGEETETLLDAFTTAAIAPTIERETLWNPTRTSIQLNAKVNTHNSLLSDCHLEYGTTIAYGSTAPCEAPIAGDPYAAPEDNSSHVVSARISGLTPNTEYHFRLVATNSAGTSEGEDRDFATLAAPAEESCSNQSIRIAQHATHLPDCRAFEKVSPAEKGNGDIVADGWSTVAAKEGDAVAFNTRTPFGDTAGSGTIGQTQYVGRRTDQGWDVHGVTPKPRPDAKQSVFAPTLLQIYSEDLRTAVVRGYDLPGASDEWPAGWPPRNNIYVEDTESRDLQTVTLSQVGIPSIFDFLQYPQVFWGISADARHVAFVAEEKFGGVTQFLPDGAALGYPQGEPVPNVYQWDEGVLSLAGILPDGTVPPGGSDSPNNLRGAMSADGSRLLFTAPPVANTQLYLRIDGERTAWVSETELEPSDPNYNPDPAGVQVKGMTPDGRNVFFTTETPLLPGDTAPGADLYRWTDSPDPASEPNLTLISQSGALGGSDLVGMSDDGERVYYQTTDSKTVLWDNGTSLLISTGALGVGDSGLAASPGTGRVTPDGMFLAFLSNATDNSGTYGPTGKVTNRHREMYLYSLAEDTLACVSCPPAPASADVTVLPAATQGDPFVLNAGFRPRFLSDDGRVFFSTADALVPEDTNGVLDAYLHDPATDEVSLLSSGTGSNPSSFTDASASGEDVFVATRQRLVPSDQDELVDLYDVSVGGGLDEPLQPPATPCEADGCQADQSAAPGAAPLGSKAAGAGNLRQGQNRRCGKQKRRVRRNGKVRCVRKRQSPRRRHADAERRAHR